MFKKIISVFLLVFTSYSIANDNNLNPYKKTQIAADKIFSEIMKQKQAIKTNPEILKNIVVRDLLPYVHTKYAAALSLGEHYKNLNKKERDDYFNAFEAYFVQTFCQVLAMYDGQEYKVENEKDLSNKNLVAVRVLLTDKKTSSEPIKFDFQWRKNTSTGEWQTYDLVVEGISMLTTKQGEWSTMVRQKGINGLINYFNEQTKLPINSGAISQKK